MSNTNILKVSYQVQETGSNCLIYRDSQVPYSNIKLNGTDITNSVSVASDEAYYTFNSPGTYEIDYILTGDTIGNDAFAFSNAEYSGYIVSIEVPSCVTHLGTTDFAYTFAIGNGATNIILNEGLEYIGGRAFETINTCSAITIPSTVNHIGCNAFYNFDYAEFTFAGYIPPTFNMSENGDLGNPSVIYVPTGSLSDYIVAAPFYESKYQEYTPGLTTKDIAAAYIGTDSVAKIYLGDEVVWPTSQPGPEPPTGNCICTGDWPNCIPCSEFPISSAPLTYQILSAGTIHLRMMPSAETQAVCEYKVYNTDRDYYDSVLYDAEEPFGTGFWNVLSASSEPDSTSSIDVQPGQYVAIRANKGTSSWCMRYGTPTPQSAYANIFSGTAIFNLMGNMMSLNFPLITGPSENNYINLTTSVAFSGSSFRCSFVDMFFGSHVVSAKYLRLPDYVPSYGFCQIFYNCADLVEAPQLHNQNQSRLATSCYMGLFGNCTSLTTAPELLHTGALESNCYQNMFSGCTNLNYVKCLESFSPSGNFSRWMIGVSPTGTFVKHPNVTNWPSGESGIPNGWTVQDAVL